MYNKMDAIPFLMLGFYGLGFLTILIIIFFLIVKRVKDKKKETFEDRNN